MIEKRRLIIEIKKFRHQRFRCNQKQTNRPDIDQCDIMSSKDEIACRYEDAYCIAKAAVCMLKKSVIIAFGVRIDHTNSERIHTSVTCIVLRNNSWGT